MSSELDFFNILDEEKIKELLDDEVISDTIFKFISNLTVRDYLKRTATRVDEFLKDLADYPIVDKDELIITIGLSFFPFSMIDRQYLKGIDSKLLIDPLPTEVRFWILSRKKNFPYSSKEEERIILNYPNLYPAWKHFPLRVKKWLEDEQFRLSLWPYSDVDLPEKLAYETLMPNAELFPRGLISYDWTNEFPSRALWIEANRKYRPN